MIDFLAKISRRALRISKYPNVEEDEISNKIKEIRKKTKIEVASVQRTREPGSKESEKCKFCGNQISSVDNIIKHCFAEHNYCMDCKQKFDSKSEAINHLNSVHTKPMKLQAVNTNENTVKTEPEFILP